MNHMDWFDPSKDAVLNPLTDQSRFWRRKFQTDQIEVSHQVIFASNNHGEFFDRVVEVLSKKGKFKHDYTKNGYVLVTTEVGDITVFAAPDTAPYSATALERLIVAGAKEILFLNGAGSLTSEIPIGSIVNPSELIREEGTSFHYVPSDITLCTSKEFNQRLGFLARQQGIAIIEGKHWTTDAIYRETVGKVNRFRANGVLSVDMELSALVAVSVFHGCEIAALHVITDIVEKPHKWYDNAKEVFSQGADGAANLAVEFFMKS